MEKDLKDVEQQIAEIFEKNLSGVLGEEEKGRLKNLELKKSNILAQTKAKWCLKNRPIWLKNSDENTKFP